MKPCTLLAALVLLLAQANAAALEWRPSVAIDVEPGIDAATFEVVATVSDAGTGAVLGQPRTVVPAGTTANLVVGGPNSPPYVAISVTVDATATRVAWQWDVFEGGLSMANSRGTMTLQRPREPGY